MSPDHVGQQFATYRSGGMGHLPGDESRSVVGMVPIRALKKFVEYQPHEIRSQARKSEIHADLAAGGQIREPLMLEYNHDLGHAYLGEGHHRLYAAEAAGHTHVPVRVTRSRVSVQYRKDEGKGAPLKMSTNFDNGDYSYVPSDIHPHHFEALK